MATDSHLSPETPTVEFHQIGSMTPTVDESNAFEAEEHLNELISDLNDQDSQTQARQDRTESNASTQSWTERRNTRRLQKKQKKRERRDAKMVKFINNVIKCCEDNSGFDIYQLQAFKSQTKQGCKDHISYMLNMIKCLLCGLTQVFGIIIIMYDFVKEGLEKREGWCHTPEYDTDPFEIFVNSNLKILAFLFSSFLAYWSMDALLSMEKGMYHKMKYAAMLTWINPTWLKFGFSVNAFVAIAAVYGSFLVIFFSDNSLDMVLNSVALFFVVELDDLLVKQDDYEQVQSYVVAHQSDESKRKRGCCSKCCSCLALPFTVSFVVIRYGTFVLCMVIPLAIGYCY